MKPKDKQRFIESLHFRVLTSKDLSKEDWKYLQKVIAKHNKEEKLEMIKLTNSAKKALLRDNRNDRRREAYHNKLRGKQ